MAAQTPRDTMARMADRATGSEMEHRTRKERNFDETESTLPDIKSGTAGDHRPTRLQKLFSYLGPLNPLPSNVSKSDTVWLLDNTAYRSAMGGWEAEFVVALFDQDSGVEVSTVVADIAEKVGLGKGDKAEETIRQRITPFVQTVLPGRIAVIDYADEKLMKTSPGSRNGISSDIRPLHFPRGCKDGDIVKSTAKVPAGANGILQMKTVYAEPEGWGLISDIDDSIKITQTSDPIGILRSTFVDEPTPITGMPALYKFIREECIGPTAPFFYLSASPYNLYAFLRPFLDEYYPPGTMILRDASWMNLSGLLSNLTLGTQDYKADRITKIHSWLPKKKMICVGDSTQSDPEAYGEIYRKYPGWIKLILIRKVTDIAAVGIAAKNEPERFEKAFEGVAKEDWFLFETPEQCKEIVQATMQRNA